MSRSPEVDKAEEEMERGHRPWLPSSWGTGKGRGILLAGPWTPDSEVKLGRSKVVPVVNPTGYGRPRGDANAYPVDDVMALRSAAPGPGSVGAVPWARPEEARCLDGED